MTESQADRDARAIREMFDNGLNAAKDEEDKKADILRRVRGLMSRASRDDTPHEEAEKARRLADKLMTKYALDNWMIAQDGEPDRMPKIRMFDFDWWSSTQLKDQLYSMFIAMAKHCRCQAVPAKWGYTGEGYRMPVAGLDSDLDWLDLLFTNVMIAMIDKVDPRARSGISVDENMARMREAGMPWGEALNRLALAGVVPSLAQERAQAATDEDGIERTYNDDDLYRWDGRHQTKLFFSKRVYERTITSYRNWCARTGREQSKVSQVTFRRNFANGFSAEIKDRLYQMRRESEASYDADHKAGSMALAVRDIAKIVEETIYVMYPDLRPHPSGCDCDIHHYCHDANCMRPNCVARRDYRPVRVSGRMPKAEKVDRAAVDAGRASGRQVDLSNSASDRIGGQKGLNS
jgi:hypothetical protein